MNIQRVKLGAKITLYNGIYMVILGIFYILSTQLNMANNFNAVKLIWKNFVKYNPKIANIFFFYNITQGILLVCVGIFVIYLSYFIIKRKEKMAWIIMFLSGIIAWASILTISIIMQNILLIILNFIGWLTFIIGMILPIKYYAVKRYREY